MFNLKISVLFSYLLLFISFVCLSAFLLLSQIKNSSYNEVDFINVNDTQNLFREVSFNVVSCENKVCPQSVYNDVLRKIDYIKSQKDIIKSDQLVLRLEMLENSFLGLKNFNKDINGKSKKDIDNKFIELKNNFSVLYRKTIRVVINKNIVHSVGKSFVRVHHLNSLIKDAISTREITYFEEAQAEISKIKISLANILDNIENEDIKQVANETFVVLEEYSEKLELLKATFKAYEDVSHLSDVTLIGEISTMLQGKNKNSNLKKSASKVSEYFEYIIIISMLGLFSGLWGMWVIASGKNNNIEKNETVIKNHADNSNLDISKDEINDLIEKNKQMQNQLKDIVKKL